jgi:hypothetical protein
MLTRRLTVRCAAAAVAMLVSAGGARAYSDEAIKDAQKLVEFMANRFAAGTADSADVARARYQLIDMRRRAGKMAHAAFCKAAQDELKRVVLRFEEGAGQAGQKAKWQGEIAGMARSAAACDRAAATADRLIYGISTPTHSPAGVKEAEERVSAAQQRVAAGTMSTREFEQTQYELLVEKYGAKQIVLKAYCDEGLRHLGMIVDLAEQQVRDGRTDIADALQARISVERLKAACRSR